MPLPKPYRVLAMLGLALMALHLGACASSNDATGVLFRTVRVIDPSTDGQKGDFKYAVYVPRAVSGDPRAERNAGNFGSGWPAILFLNGRGECGTDGQRQLTQGLMPAVLNKPEEWPFIIIFPQKPLAETQWEDHHPLVIAALEKTQAEYRIDPSRVYLTGLSQGGHGTWMIAAMYPDRFAAIAPICGYGPNWKRGGDSANTTADLVPIAQALGSMQRGGGGMPVWAFHGAKDDVVPSLETEKMVGALREAGNTNVEMTIYPDLNHGSWDRAYRESGLGAWFLKHDTMKRVGKCSFSNTVRLQPAE